MKKIRLSLCIAVLTAGLGLAACNSSQPENPPATAPAGSSAGNAAASDSTALKANQVKAAMALQGSPVLSTDGQSVQVTVQLSNQGTAAWPAQGQYPVHLGAHLLDTQGRHVINNDLARGILSGPVAPGASENVTIQLPRADLPGHSVALLPVQEQINWFDAWGTQPLHIGPFSNCSPNGTQTICDASGKPLAAAGAPAPAATSHG